VVVYFTGMGGRSRGPRECAGGEGASGWWLWSARLARVWAVSTAWCVVLDKGEWNIAGASSAGNGLSDEVMQSCSRSLTAPDGDDATQAELLFAQVALVLAWMRRGEVLPTLRPGTRRWAWRWRRMFSPA
jgi:hypothetical protein